MDHPSLTASKRQTASRPSGSTPPAGKRRELDSADAGGDDSAFTTIEGENVVPDLLLVATAAAPVNFLDGTPVSSSIALASSTSSHLLQCDVQAPHVKVHADGAAAATAGDSTISSIAAVDELKHLVDKVSHLGASAVARGITAMTSVIAAIEEGEASSASSAHALVGVARCERVDTAAGHVTFPSAPPASRMLCSPPSSLMRHNRRRLSSC